MTKIYGFSTNSPAIISVLSLINSNRNLTVCLKFNVKRTGMYQVTLPNDSSTTRVNLGLLTLKAQATMSFSSISYPQNSQFTYKFINI